MSARMWRSKHCANAAVTGRSCPGLPPELEWLINRMIEMDCEVRCQSAAELRAKLQLQRKVEETANNAAVTEGTTVPREREKQCGDTSHC